MTSSEGFLQSLNEELLADIFKKLSVEDLCRICCVCKSWNSLISSSFFTAYYGTVADSGAGKSYFLWNNYADRIKGACSYAFYDPRVSLADQYPTFRRDPFLVQSLPHGRPSPPFRLAGLVRGVACLLHPDSIVLWNPVIHKHVEIPPSPSHKRTLTAAGFGFDGRRRYDYGFKVVMIQGVLPPRNRGVQLDPPCFEVFSTREGGRWRHIAAGHIAIDIFETIEGCFSNGVIYWIVSRYLNDDGFEKFLLMFDCEHDEFKTRELPNQFNRPEITWGRIFTCGGALSIFMVLQSLESEMWTMEEHGAVTTWKKSIVQEDLVKIVDDQVDHYVDGRFIPLLPWVITRLKELRVKQPLNSYVLEKSMFLMDAKSQATSFTAKRDGDGNVCYVKAY